MIYQDIGDGRSSLEEEVTDLVFLASLPPTLFWLPVTIACMLQGHMCTAMGTVFKNKCMV